MKVKRLKRAARVLTFFHYNFGYHPPHSILLDGTFCQAALQNKINLREQMPKYLAETPERVEMYVTECMLNELKELGKQLYGALVIAQQFHIAKCPHKPLRTAAECIAHLARRSKQKDRAHKKYFVATQDDKLLEKLRELGGVPLMSIRFNTILLEKPSQQSQLEAEKSKSTIELDRVRQVRKVELGEQQEKRHKKRKAKGPNPLSCKKKKPKTDDSGQSAFGKTTNKGSAKEIAQEEEAESKQEEKKSMSERAKKRRIRRRLMVNGQALELLAATPANRPPSEAEIND